MGNIIETTTASFTYYNGHRCIIFEAHQPLGPGCTCSKCGNPINKPKHSPVRVTDIKDEHEMRFHAQCFKDINEMTATNSHTSTTSTTST